MTRVSATLLMIAAGSAGCGAASDASEPAASSPSPDPPARAVAPPPPDAGTPAGHGVDRRRVAVPDRDATPPQAVIVLATRDGEALAEAAMPGEGSEEAITLEDPTLLGTTIGRDHDSGVARLRVSLKERLVCRSPSGAPFERLRTRYLPPSQIERIKASPGARLPTTKERPERLRLSGRARCGGAAELLRIDGELWGEAINGFGLEAVTPHIHFRRVP